MIKASDMLIARRADTKARADFSTWRMMAKLNATDSLASDAQTFLASYDTLAKRVPEAEAAEATIETIYRSYYTEMGGVGTPPALDAVSAKPADRDPAPVAPQPDNVIALQRPRPKRPQRPAGPVGKPRLPVALIFICLVAIVVGFRYLLP